MDGRVLINHSPGKSLADIVELSGWSPAAPRFHAAGPVRKLEPVSLVIPTFFNTELKGRSLVHLLAGLERCQSVREIILVSSDGEAQDFSHLQSCLGERVLRVVESDPHNRGKSRNAGAAAATSPNLLFLDDDMLLRDWRAVDVLLSHLLTTRRDAALFPRRHYARFPLLFDPFTLRSVIDLWRLQGNAKGSPFLYDPLAEGARDLPMLFCFPGCFMLIRREAYQRLRGFSEDFVGWGFEDTDFGMRAMQELNVVNLFRVGDPLLHIDHPVSPYKSEEHNANYRKFYACPESPDINLFCRRVFRGTNFRRGDEALATADSWVAPLKQVRRLGIPLDVERAKSWWMSVARRRLRQHRGPLPRFIVLHGSRADRTARTGDDYDVLNLYEGGGQEFFVSSGDTRVELECADMRHFEHIASHPAIHSFTGSMELAKVACARLLWGEEAEWRKWSTQVSATGMKHGWTFWLVLGLGMRRHASKYGPMVDRYFRSLGKLRAHAIAAGQFQVNGEGDFSDELALALAAIHGLDESAKGWRERVRAGEPVFELQGPEVWTALYYLMDLSFPVEPRRLKPRSGSIRVRPRKLLARSGER